VYSRAGVFILEHYFASKSFVAVFEAFGNEHPDKEVLNKTTIQYNKISGHRKCLCVFGKAVDIGVKLFYKFFLTNKN
jgi:hypothetical protein